MSEKDLYSWNVEQSQGQDANILTILMRERAIGIQEAIDVVADKVHGNFRRYLACQQNLPSWGSASVDRDVRTWLKVLEDWCVGYSAWSLESRRYFGENTPRVRESLRVPVLPCKARDDPSKDTRSEQTEGKGTAREAWTRFLFERLRWIFSF